MRSGVTQDDRSESKALQLVTWIYDKAIDGVPPLTSARDLAEQYLVDRPYCSLEERVSALIREETSKNFTTDLSLVLAGC